ncbi:MAG: hypothetical protein HN704_14720 [Bacteroidetes bacterium]|jgi:hypothetical protein|nr:hypothetical protein [Bacteroidota bacterium]MBT7492851.1 hypothetical protein [Bacteroidota bacterium]
MNTEQFTYKNREQYLKALDHEPPKSYFKIRKLGGAKEHTYIPGAIKEAFADAMFHQWNVFDEKYTFLGADFAVCTVKITYIPSFPGSNEQQCTGSAAVPIQGSSGNALEYQIPAIRAEAISNALQSLGNIFGRNVGRKIVPNNFALRKFKDDPDPKKTKKDN